MGAICAIRGKVFLIVAQMPFMAAFTDHGARRAWLQSRHAAIDPVLFDAHGGRLHAPVVGG
jgi:hypothetical protein